MFHVTRGFLFYGILTVLTVLTGTPKAWSEQVIEPQESLIIAVQPTLATSEILEKAKPLEEALEKAIGNVDVKIYAPMSYASAVEALRFGHAHAALMGAWPAKLAVDMAGAEIPLAEVREVIHDQEKTEATYYFSYWVVRKDSPYQNLEDLREKDVCFPSPISSSGFVAPLGRLVGLGFVSKAQGHEADPGQFFGTVLFGGGYAQCWEALKSGQVETTVIAGDVPEKLYQEVLAATRTLEKQGPIPSHAVVLSKDLKEPLRTKVIEAFTNLGEPEFRPLMRSFISGIFVGFQPTTAGEHLKGLNDYLELSGLPYTERIVPKRS